MKKLLIILFLGASALVSKAQFKMPSVEERVADATEKIGLTEEQQTEWTNIFEKYDTKMKDAREKRDRSSMKASREEMDEELQATLTEEQQEKYTAWNESRRSKRRF